MKHLKFFNESKKLINDIASNFQFINDEYGSPKILTAKYGKEHKFTFGWFLGNSITAIQPIDITLKKIKTLHDLLLDVKSASSMFDEYDFNVQIGLNLVVEVVPKLKSEEDFEFIEKYDYRTLRIYKNEIDRFLKSRGAHIYNWEEKYDDYLESAEVIISINSDSISAAEQFREMFEAELQLKQSEIEREYYCSIDSEGSSQIFITITSNDEKSNIELI